MDGNTCCMYFCTGLSVFGVVCLVRCAPLWLSLPSNAPISRTVPTRRATRTLCRIHAHVAHQTACGTRRHPARQAIMGVILNSGGAWYLGVKEEDAGTAAASCYLAAAVYGIYMIMCGLRIVKANSKARGRAQINDEEDH